MKNEEVILSMAEETKVMTVNKINFFWNSDLELLSDENWSHFKRTPSREEYKSFSASSQHFKADLVSVEKSCKSNMCWEE